MKKLQKREPVFKGEITAFLALIFILMLSVVGALIESASIQITKNRKRADTLLALESVFAEYDRELLDKYDLFAHKGSNEYEISTRLSYYGADNMTHFLEKTELLTDQNGAPFFRQAVRYVKNWLGTDDVESGSSLDIAEDSSLEEDADFAGLEIEELLSEKGEELPTENNPLGDIQRLRDTDLLTLVVGEGITLSEEQIEVDALPSRRELQQGNYELQAESSVSDKVFFLAYIAEHFGAMTDGEEDKALLYEQEYLLGGYPSDKENLEETCEKILGIRTVANYAYLLTDDTKQAEADVVATALCSLLTVPEVSQLVKYVLLFGWAYGESIVDVRALLKGKRVPMVKTAETWQLQLANLAKLGTAEEVSGEKDSTSGLSYKDYLKAFLLLEDETTLCMRSLDLIESNLKIKMDECMTKAEIKTKVSLRRGVQDSFTTKFEYQ